MHQWVPVKRVCYSSAFKAMTTEIKLTVILMPFFDEKMGRLYRASVNDAQDLLPYYFFDSQWADFVKDKIEALVG